MARPKTRSTPAKSKRSRNQKSEYFESESSGDDRLRSKSSKAKRAKSNKLAAQESDEEPWETFVPKEPSPDAGDMDYQNSTIHPNTLHFLTGYLPVGKVNSRFSGE